MTQWKSSRLKKTLSVLVAEKSLKPEMMLFSMASITKRNKLPFILAKNVQERNKMELFYITFDQTSPFRNYYIIVYAKSPEDALHFARREYKHIAYCYKEYEIQKEYFPGGLLNILK